MPAPTYTVAEVALHEVGHAAVACALNLPIDRVGLHQKVDSRKWGGQCFLRSDLVTTFPQTCAFQMGGPVVQTVMEPASLGSFSKDVTPSVFHRADSLGQFSALVDSLEWGGDLGEPPIVLLAPKASHFQTDPLKQYATWLAPLEKTISVFLAKDWVGGFIRSAQLDLVANFSLDGRTLKASFDSLARADDLESIRSEIIQADSIWARREGSGLNFFPGF